MHLFSAKCSSEKVKIIYLHRLRVPFPLWMFALSM